MIRQIKLQRRDRHKPLPQRRHIRIILRLPQLKQTVLAKLPPFTAAKLADKDARSSPILSALIAGELAMQTP
jgi:hypothetical protein